MFLYANAPYERLSGGAIAGIVIGSVAVAGIGGFAVLWFAVKKKNFKDLGEAFKRMGEAFKRMGEALKRKCEELKNKSKKNKDNKQNGRTATSKQKAA